jgi:DNA modification methylase
MTTATTETENELEASIDETNGLSCSLAHVYLSDDNLNTHFSHCLGVEPLFTRQLVSFQVSKNEPVYRWFKYKEAFSAALVQQLLQRDELVSGVLLDPFAGSGTSLFAASALGLDAHGIELLPIGRQIFETRRILESEFTSLDLASLQQFATDKPWQTIETRVELPTLRITQGAYSPANVEAIEKFMAAILLEKERVQQVLRFALLCVLESVSFTRKDGQYLRWDARANKRESSRPFNKGIILDFDAAITAKLMDIMGDNAPALQHSLFPTAQGPMAERKGEMTIWADSCLDRLPQLPDSAYCAIVTSPPYCNRYDYTRTYALELALLGVDQPGIVAMRQEMLSCTVENRAKDLLAKNPDWKLALKVAGECELLQAVLAYLDKQKSLGVLNNTGIARMVRGYFVEMACVIQESARILEPGAVFWMVNDNVRYAGCPISVDLILSYFAENLGFEVEAIYVLPSSKGNSSQQMGEHGRHVLRKCVYKWRKR